jgi:hypothetical protein
MKTAFLSGLALLILPLALAASGPKARDVATIVSEQQEIRAGVLAGEGRYADLPARKRDELVRRQDALLKMLDGKESTDDLPERSRIEAFNTLEWIEAVVNKEDDERMVCIRERTIGSNRLTRTCRTAAQWAEARERAREQMLKRGACTDLGRVGCI